MPDESTIRSTILDLLSSRDPDASICPSEAARAVFDDWREHMDDVREVATEMQQDGLIYATQGEERVDIGEASGPIRLRLEEPNTDE
ncbi:S-adenosylmethionine tRNA ribosyltransferase [Longibacter salinarum]|uniref:S-adenosylmethionine tRNA ribosyltransferase n=1 Tax=Longibacter salinarum TaxID=1850348 RepID=A0A2A8CTH0_9BACT|nr:DUF3253 domain-containing protein [Longibacter salinarum]PEN11169.1 S-adenosylmethionine tRNA ribosyltransferase [Longibacter salinarum]